MSQLNINLQDILDQKTSYLLPNNIRSGVTILGVQGTLEPDKPDQTKTCTPTTAQQTITPDAGYELASVTVDGVTSAVDSNIQAGNIKSGVSILGVTGNYSGIDTSDADATVDDIYQGKTAYVNGTKITGRTPNYPISNSNRFKYYYDYKQGRDLPVQQQASNIGMANIDGTVVVTLQTPAISNFNRFAFSGDNKLKSAVGALALRGKFSILPENIKTGVTMIDAVGTFSQCADRGVSNVQYKSYWFDGPFVLQSNGYYKFDGTNMGQSNLEIIFNKTTAGDVKLSYKGTNIHKEDTEDPGMYLSETNITVDNSTILTPPEDSSEYIDITITNMSVGEHTILIETYGDSDTVLEIKLLEETPISTANISKGLTGFVNGNKIEGTYEPDIELDLSSITYTGSSIGILLERLDMAGIPVTKINHSIDCTSDVPNNLRGVGSMEEYLTLVNTSAMTSIYSSMFNGWTSVKRIPLFDTSGITDWGQSLDQMLMTIYQTIEVLPAFDMSGQQNMQSFIYSGYTLSPLNNCSNLSYESINNLMASLLTLPQQPGQIPQMFCTLARLGLDVGYSGNMFDASEIETLSNYPAFTAAGWSIV